MIWKTAVESPTFQQFVLISQVLQNSGVETYPEHEQKLPYAAVYFWKITTYTIM